MDAVLASVINEKSWKQDLTADSSLDEVLARGHDMKLPEKKNIKAIVDG